MALNAESFYMWSLVGLCVGYMWDFLRRAGREGRDKLDRDNFRESLK